MNELQEPASRTRLGCTRDVLVELAIELRRETEHDASRFFWQHTIAHLERLSGTFSEIAGTLRFSDFHESLVVLVRELRMASGVFDDPDPITGTYVAVAHIDDAARLAGNLLSLKPSCDGIELSQAAVDERDYCRLRIRIATLLEDARFIATGTDLDCDYTSRSCSSSF